MVQVNRLIPLSLYNQVSLEPHIWRVTMPLIVLCVGLLTILDLSAQEPNGESERYLPQQLSAKDLIYTCAASSLTSRGRERRRYCFGFVSGVEEALRLLAGQSAPGTLEQPCVPKGTTARQLTNIFTRHANTKTTELDRPAALVVIESLLTAFPCNE